MIKKGLNLLEAFDGILGILSNDGVSQVKLRRGLQRFFNIKEQ